MDAEVEQRREQLSRGWGEGAVATFSQEAEIYYSPLPLWERVRERGVFESPPAMLESNEAALSFSRIAGGDSTTALTLPSPRGRGLYKGSPTRGEGMLWLGRMGTAYKNSE